MKAFSRGAVLAGVCFSRHGRLRSWRANYFHYQIFLNIDFLWGSIFSMLVLQFFGGWAGASSRPP